MADFCSEPGSAEYSRGVCFHRAIDAFTDTHAQVAGARQVFTIRRLGGVMTDLAFDFCLSRTWNEWESIPRASFIDSELARLAERNQQLPASARLILNRVSEERWLHNYHTIEGIAETISRIARRRPVAKQLLGAERSILDHLDEITTIFRAFYPELIEYANEQAHRGT